MRKLTTTPGQKQILCILDFDGFLVDSYKLLKTTFVEFGLDLGDVERFQHRRKFLKYMGGGKEFLGNLVSYTLPKKHKIRKKLTETYMEEGKIYPQFTALLNRMIENPACHVGIISRNFTHNPGLTIRKVLRNSGVNEVDLDFVIPIPIGGKKHEVLEGMHSGRYLTTLFGADEIGDFHAASETGYDTIIMASYGFDNRKRLIKHGEVPPDIISDSVEDTVARIESGINIILPSRSNGQKIK